MKTFSLANHKGGVGKTTTVHNLGALMAEIGWRVLMVGIDPQASLTSAVGIGDCSDRSMAEVLGGYQPGELKLEQIILNIAPGLDLAPSDLAMANVELGLSQRMGRENVLKNALSAVADRYDITLIDCGPSLGLLTVNGLVASNEVIVPCQPSVLDLRGVSLFLKSLETIRNELNPNLHLFGILITQYDRRYTHHRDAVETIQAANLDILPVMIGRSVKVAEASGAGQPITTYEPGNPQAKNYRELALLLCEWMDGHNV
jgi:chromosome partitioning protein